MKRPRNVWHWWWRHEHPIPPAPPKPPPPPPAASWTLGKPLVFTGWDPTQARSGPWAVATICATNGAWDAWSVTYQGAQVGWIAQAETPDQHDQAVKFLDGKTGHRAVVATQGGWMNPAPFAAIGVDVCFGEAYEEDDPSHTPDVITWQEKHDGWAYAYPVVGTYHNFPLRTYALGPWQPNVAVWLAEEMSDDDWSVLEALAH